VILGALDKFSDSDNREAQISPNFFSREMAIIAVTAFFLRETIMVLSRFSQKTKRTIISNNPTVPSF
jgi:hypothetical protein